MDYRTPRLRPRMETRREPERDHYGWRYPTILAIAGLMLLAWALSGCAAPNRADGVQVVQDAETGQVNRVDVYTYEGDHLIISSYSQIESVTVRTSDGNYEHGGTPR